LVEFGVLLFIAKCTGVRVYNPGTMITARCYAERGYATLSRLSVCLSVMFHVQVSYRTG